MKKLTALFVCIASVLMVSCSVSNAPKLTAAMKSRNITPCKLRVVLMSDHSAGLDVTEEEINLYLGKNYPSLSVSLTILPTQDYANSAEALITSGQFDIIYGDYALLSTNSQHFAALEPYMRGAASTALASRPGWLNALMSDSRGMYALPSLKNYTVSYALAVDSTYMSAADAAAITDTSTPEKLLSAVAPFFADVKSSLTDYIMKPLTTEELSAWALPTIAEGISYTAAGDNSYSLSYYYSSDVFSSWVKFAREWYMSGKYPLTPVSEPQKYADAKAKVMLVELSSDADKLKYPGYTLIPAFGPIVNANASNIDGLAVNAASENIMECVELIELLNTDAAIYDLFTIGAKGENYRLQDGVVEFIQDNDNLYYVPETLLGAPQNSSYLSEDQKKAYLTPAADVVTPLSLGFTLDESGIEAELKAIRKVIKGYDNRLSNGVMKYPEDTLNAMNKALDKAGISKVMDTVLEQLRAAYPQYTFTAPVAAENAK